MSQKFQIICPDPPWKFQSRGKNGDAKAPPYPLMTTRELMRMNVEEFAADDAYLIMWIYDPMYVDAFKLADAWGFPTFICPLFRWFKTQDDQLRLFDPTPKPGFGHGYHTRGGACEEAWLFKRGKGLKVKSHSVRREFFAPIREHSRKPDEVYDKFIPQLYGEVSRVELFARTVRPGWDTRFSNQVGRFRPVDKQIDLEEAIAAAKDRGDGGTTEQPGRADRADVHEDGAARDEEAPARDAGGKASDGDGPVDPGARAVHQPARRGTKRGRLELVSDADADRAPGPGTAAG